MTGGRIDWQVSLFAQPGDFVHTLEDFVHTWGILCIHWGILCTPVGFCAYPEILCILLNVIVNIM
jgi:hypothetical protein